MVVSYVVGRMTSRTGGPIGGASQQGLVPVVFGIPGHVRPKLAACAGAKEIHHGIHVAHRVAELLAARQSTTIAIQAIPLEVESLVRRWRETLGDSFARHFDCQVDSSKAARHVGAGDSNALLESTRVPADAIAAIREIERGTRDGELFAEHLCGALDDRAVFGAGILIVVVGLFAIWRYRVRPEERRGNCKSHGEKCVI